MILKLLFVYRVTCSAEIHRVNCTLCALSLSLYGSKFFSNLTCLYSLLYEFSKLGITLHIRDTSDGSNSTQGTSDEFIVSFYFLQNNLLLIFPSEVPV